MSFTRTCLLIAGWTLALLVPLGTAAAQQSGKPPGETRPAPERKAPDKPETGKPETGKPEAGKPESGKPDLGKPEAGAGRKPEGDSQADNAQPNARPSPKPPQTAEEKARQLSDLYALLATAEDEDTARKHTSAIERLWMYSGSDTVAMLMQRAAAAMSKKDNGLARKLLDYVVTLAPDYPEGFNQRAYLHFSLNDYDSAVGDLRRVLALDPNHYKALEGLSQIWRESGNKKGALGVMKQLIDVHPFAAGGKTALEELKREVEGQGI